MSAITTHVLDAVLGRPAAGISLRMEKQMPSGWVAVGSSITDGDGRCRDIAPDASDGIYRLTFDVGDYFKSQGRTSIYPQVTLTFMIDGERSYHLPLLLSDNSYTTYRGS
jgi:5-hydroxyisourate hydrolase